MSARFLVGIDLGTTHTVVAYAELDPGGTRSPRGEPVVRPEVHNFEVPQLVAPGEVSARSLLPSFRYHPLEQELKAHERQLPWPAPRLADEPIGVLGTLAQRLGAQVPGRLVASAKSWLSHSGVEREAAILPWGAPDDVPKVSPVAASASYLAHIRAAWENAHPDAPLSQQQVVLTVPASFDEVARTLTLTAARRAGIEHIRLLEEPQAAVYDWIDRSPDLAQALHEVRLLLVLDVGGGTTDLSLIQIHHTEDGPQLTRIAVGDHLMLGGDNMDLGLSRRVEAQLGGGDSRLSAAEFSQLQQQCRAAKEQLLAAEGPEQVKVTLLGRGQSLVGSARSATLSRAETVDWLLAGFAPEVELFEQPQTRKGGLVEFGLPYVSDPAITRHLAAFLLRHRDAAAEALGSDGEGRDPLPDAVLFNGGVFRSEHLHQRILDVLSNFAQRPVVALDNPAPDHAVARGAVVYGLARAGVGLRIGGGSARSYFVELGKVGTPQGVCVLPRGAEEGEDVWLRGRRFALRVGEPVHFRLWTHSADRGHRPGDVVPLQAEGFIELPTIATIIDAADLGQSELTVELHTTLTEVGTLCVSCVSVEQPSKRYRLEFQLRESGSVQQQSQLPITELHPRFEEAAAVVRVYYGKSDKRLQNRKVKALRSELEQVLGERSSWDTVLLRELFSVLLAGARRRFRSTEHEHLWLNLSGFCLRPGYGYPLDEWRVQQLYSLYEHGVQHAQQAAVWSQWWILWRRIAGGLDAQQQAHIADSLAYYLEPTHRPRPRPKGPKALAIEDMARLVGALERLQVERKVEFGHWLLTRMERGELPKTLWWSVGRLGARALLYGSAHTVVPGEVAQSWLQRALQEDLSRLDQAALAAAQLARRTDDRARDLPEAIRKLAADKLVHAGAYDGWIDLIRKGGALSAADQARVFGDALPAGLTLL